MAIDTKTVINIMYTSRHIEKTIDQFRQHDLTMQQYNVLRILRGQKGQPANLSTIQERMIDKNSNTTRLVDKLIEKGLTRRQQCEANRRKVEIFITDKGMDLLSTLDPLTEKINREIVSNLSHTEKEKLNQLLDKLRNDE
ncbi:MarR family winged helix-turn-helix transcriptional regulator [Aureitalea marina]